MNTLVCVLSAFLGQAEEPASLWQQSYTQAQKIAAQDNKAVAVFLTKGEGGLRDLIPGGLSLEAQRLLTDKYAAVMVDSTTPEGQRLARAFQMRDGQGLVLSDRGGNLQAFWYQGNLTNQDLVRNLEKYGNVTNVRMTEVARGRTALYPPVDAQGKTVQPVNQTMQPTTIQPQTQRRFGLRNSDQRTRLFQGRLLRRNTTY
jgi:hypothetical protein